MKPALILNFLLNIIFPPSPLYDAATLKRSSGSVHDFVYPVFDYKDKKVEHMIWELKFYKNKKVAKIFAPLLYEEIKEESILIPVPISKRKRRERGFNQTELLCEEIMRIDKHFILTYMPKVLVKHKNTKNQHDLKDKSARLSNLKNAFKVIKPSAVSNQNVIIIDDVYTTGATLLEIKKVLEEAGAKSVRAITIAH